MKQILLSALLLITHFAIAQPFKTEMSVMLSEDPGTPELTLKNGYTLFAKDDPKKKAITLTLFNEKHKQIAQTDVAFSQVDISRKFASQDVTIWVLGYYEINGDIVMFVRDNKVERKLKCGLYRIILDAKTTKVKKEELLMSVNKGGFARNNPVNSYGIDAPFYFIAKDPASDYYAIVKYGYQKKDNEDCNYEVYHYSPEHKEINKAKFDYVNGKYMYARALNVAVNADKYVFISTYAFNEESKRGKDTKIVFSKLEQGSTSFIHKELDYSEDFSASLCTLKKNAKNNIYEALIYVEVRKGSGNMTTYYQLIFQGIDPEKMELNKPFTLPQDQLDKFVATNCGESKGYKGGMINSFNVTNAGNNIAILKKNVTGFYDGGSYSLDPELYGFIAFDVDGKELNAWAYPHTDNLMFSISNAKGDFMIMNEMEKNMDLPLNKKHGGVKEVLSNAVIITLKDNGEMSKEYLFGTQGEGNNMYVDKIKYDQQSNTAIAVVGVGKDKKNKKIVWVKFE
jgi:hypothetical protein